MTRSALLLAACLAFAVTTARAAPLADVRGTDAQEQLAADSLRALEQAVADEKNDELLDARARLVLLDDVGLRTVAARLEAGDISDLLLPHLLQVIASSAHPEVDRLLIPWATAERAEIRMRVADALGQGRTDAAVPALTALAADPVAGVRAAALRSLFALETDAAVAARQALAPDPRSDLNARRLRWHRKRGRAGAAVRELALTTWETGRTAKERIAAAKLLANPRVKAPLAALEKIVAELGSSEADPKRGPYDSLDAREAVILAAWMASQHPEADATLRASMIDRLVGWLARPVRADPLDPRPIPENLLRMVLPDFGAVLVDPTVRRLRGGRFWDPQDGVALLVEALDASEAATVLRSLLVVNGSPKVPLPVRVAAASGLATLGAVGDEALARLLLAPEEDAAVRRDALTAVGQDPGLWAVPLLGEVAERDDPALSPAAVRALEARVDDPGARDLLVTHLFERAKDPSARMGVLLQKGDDAAYEVLERALGHPRSALRRAALQQMQKVPALENDRSRALLRAYQIRSTGPRGRTHEIQQVLYAYFALLPEESVPWMQAHWEEFASLNWTPIAIRSLQNLKHEAVKPAIVDLVLGITDETEEVDLLQEAATALDERAGYRDEELDAFWRRLLTHENEDLVVWALLSLEHPGRGDLTPELLALLNGFDKGSEDDFIAASAILDVFEHQPWAPVEPTLLDLFLDVHTLDALRHRIGTLLVGRASESARARLLDWLTDPETASADPLVQRLAARVIGEGGDSEVARRVLTALEDRLRALYAEGRFEDPLDERQAEPAWDLPALAHAVAWTRDEDALTSLYAMVFDDRLARYARRAIEGQARRLGPTDASGAGHLTPKPYALWLRVKGGFAPMPDEIYRTIDRTTPAGDPVLAAAIGRVLSEAAASGRLASFPDPYLDRVIAPLANPESGDHAQATSAVGAWVGRLEPVGGAVDFFAARDRVVRLTRAGSFAQAATEQRRVLEILARRTYDDERGWPWRRERAHLEALEAAATCAAGDAAGAEAGFQRAVRWHPFDAQVLQQTARIRALAGCGLEQALALAFRARVLEWRVFTEMGVATGDTLALVLLKLDRPEEARRAVLEFLPKVKPEPHLGGRYHLRLAQTLAAGGDEDAAAEAVLQALSREPTLAGELAEDPWLVPLQRSGRLKALVARAEADRLESLLQ